MHTFDHELHRLGPACDDLVRGKCSWGAAVVTGVELRPRRPVLGAAALVVALARGAGQRMAIAVARAEDLVLEPGGQRDHTLLGLVLRQKLLAERLVRGRSAAAEQRGEPGRGRGAVSANPALQMGGRGRWSEPTCRAGSTAARCAGGSARSTPRWPPGRTSSRPAAPSRPGRPSSATLSPWLPTRDRSKREEKVRKQWRLL